MLPRVLFAESHKYFRSNMDRNYANKHTAACAHFPREILTPADVSEGAPPDIDPGEHDILLVGVFASNPDPSDPPGSGVPLSWSARIPKRCVVLEDMRHQEDIAAFLNRHACQYLVTTYECFELEQLLRQCPHLRRVFVIPHHIDMQLYRCLDLPRIYDVLLYGSLLPRYYPFRRRLADLLRTSRLRVHIVEYPGRNAVDPERCGDSLVKLINQSWMCIATPTTSGYLVAKYLEISACGSLVAGTIPPQALPVWRDCHLRLDKSMADSEILARIEVELADKEALCRKARIAHDRVHREYSLERYVERLEDVLREIAADTL
jgi:hypothetical protein